MNNNAPLLKFPGVKSLDLVNRNSTNSKEKQEKKNRKSSLNFKGYRLMEKCRNRRTHANILLFLDLNSYK